MQIPVVDLSGFTGSDRERINRTKKMSITF